MPEGTVAVLDFYDTLEGKDGVSSWQDLFLVIVVLAEISDLVVIFTHFAEPGSSPHNPHPRSPLS